MSPKKTLFAYVFNLQQQRHCLLECSFEALYCSYSFIPPEGPVPIVSSPQSKHCFIPFKNVLDHILKIVHFNTIPLKKLPPQKLQEVVKIKCKILLSNQQGFTSASLTDMPS